MMGADDAVREVIQHWRKLPELAAFATKRHGFGDSDGGFGVIYPGDLDEYDRATGQCIPEGFVQVYGFWGPPDGYEILVPENVYLGVLAGMLADAGYSTEAASVRLQLGGES